MSHLCFVLRSHIFQVGGTKHVQFQFAIRRHSPLRPWTKHVVRPFIVALLCLLVVCNDVSYCVSYHGTCIQICIIS